MMSGIHSDYQKWLAVFKDRIRKKLIPLIQKGYSVLQILNQGLMNRLSTKNGLKVAAVNGLKVAGIKSSKEEKHKASSFEEGLRPNRVPPPLDLPCLAVMPVIANTLVNSFQMKEADANSVMNSFSLIHLKRGIRIHGERLKQGFQPRSPIAAFIHAMTSKKETGNG
jgi:hypothetical protein